MLRALRSRHRLTPVLAALLVGAPLACSDPTPASGPRNVLLISIDALRADRLGAYGYERETSPFLDELAGRGTRFANAFVNTLATPPSHTTIFSSLYQETHRVALRKTPKPWMSRRVPENVTLLQERLKTVGYRTVGVTEGGFMSAFYGWSRGFDAFDDDPRSVADGVEALLRELDALEPSGGPVFAFLHTYEVHLPYVPPREYRERFSDHRGDWVADQTQIGTIRDSPGGIRFLSDMYDAEIRYTDDALRRLFAELEARGFLDGALVVVTSDHGEEFGDHGGISHGARLYDELVKVPLFFVGDGVPAGMVDDRMVSSVDIVPTVFARLGLDPDPRFAGGDLFARRGDGAVEGDAVYMQLADRLFAVRTRQWKLIETMKPERQTELFDLQADPGEQENLAEQQPERVAELRQRLAAWRESVPRLAEPRARPGGAPRGPSKAEAERLRALGYLE
jgi:arylsulfatase A-like enzyme